MWKQAQKFLTKRNHTWDSNNTIVDILATFLLLSYSKLLLHSLFLLTFNYTLTVNITDVTFYSTRTSPDPSIDYFDDVHVVYSVAAVLILFVMVLLPALLLTFYPFRVCRSMCHLVGQTRFILHLFVEKFCSCYKDGLDGGRDMRIFASLYFYLRFGSVALIFFSFLEGDNIVVISSFFRFIMFGGVALLISTIRPYKKNYMNITDTLILSDLVIISASYTLYTFATVSDNFIIHGFILNTLTFFIILPKIGLIIYIAVKLIQKIKLVKFIKERFVSCKHHSDDSVRSSTDREDEIYLEDRNRVQHSETCEVYGEGKTFSDSTDL